MEVENIENSNKQENSQQLVNEDDLLMDDQVKKKIKGQDGAAEIVKQQENNENNNVEDQKNKEEEEEQKQQQQQQQQEGEQNQQRQLLKKPEKPSSAYIYFIKNYKQKYQEKVSLSDCGKIWKEMTKDEKAVYQQMHNQAKLKYDEDLQKYLDQQDEIEAEQLRNNPNPSNQNDQQLDQQENISVNQEIEDEIEFEFPISRIKTILKGDPSAKGFQSQSMMYISKAAELFGGYLISQCQRNLAQNKRKTMQTETLQDVIKKDPYLNFLQCLYDKPQGDEEEEEEEKLDDNNENEEIEMKEKNENEQENKQTDKKKPEKKKGRQPKAVEPPKNNMTLDQFFFKKQK